MKLKKSATMIALVGAAAPAFAQQAQADPRGRSLSFDVKYRFF